MKATEGLSALVGTARAHLPDLVRSVPKYLPLVVIGLTIGGAILAQRSTASSPADSVPIAFRLEPWRKCDPGDPKCHQDTSGIQAAFARPNGTYWHEDTKRWEHWKTFRFSNAPLNQDSGDWSVAFAGWLKDGMHGVFSSSSNGLKHDLLSHNEPVIATATEVTLRPALAREAGYPGWGGDFSPFQVVYKPGTGEIEKYLYFDQQNQGTNGIMKNFWAVNDAGTAVKLSMKDAHPRPFVAGSEGCQLSPNGKLLVCQSNASDITPDGQLNGTHCQSAMFTKNLITGGESCVTDERGVYLVEEKTIPKGGSVGFWSPDSRGFAYYRMDGSDYWLSYYEMNGVGASVTRTEKGIIPSKFCYQHSDLHCKAANQSSLAWSKDGRLFFSKVEKDGTLTPGTPRRSFCRVH